MRALGLDLGTKRIGVAVSDRSGTIASPLCVISRSGSRRADHARIAALVAEEDAEAVVVGLPLSLDGRVGPAAEAARIEASQLATVIEVPVETFDERFTTVTAQRALSSAGVPGRHHRRHVDKVAAAVMLQAFLDRRRNAIRGHGGEGGSG